MKSIFSFFVWMACFVGLHAQDKSSDTTARYFLIQASIGNLQEVAEAKVALQKASNPEVKAFAQRMIDEHSKAQAQLLQLVQARQIQIPQAALDTPVPDPMLQNTPAKDFDHMYVDMMSAGHGATVQLFEKYAWTGKDPQVKAWAAQTLPVIKAHLEAIKKIEEEMKK
jgi:putative membrane protein